MTPLSHIIRLTQKAILFIGVGIVGLILLTIGIQVFGSLKQMLLPM